MKFCSNCGNSISQRVPEGDSRTRYVCDNCDIIFYQNPKLITGTLPICGDKVVLCRRAIEPRQGYWTLPAGFMENGESTEQGALRESWEEAEVSLDNVELYRLFDLPHIDQVYIFYKGDIVDGKFGVGSESLEVALFAEDEIPWDELAFYIVGEILREYFEDRKVGQFPIRISSLDKQQIVSA